MAIIPPTEFIDELKDDSATNRWDVMVSYSEKQLNDLLAVRWRHSMKPVPLKFDIGTPIDKKFRLVQTFDVQLGEPSLQFATAGGKATLSFPIEGGWKSKMVGQAGPGMEMDDVTIPQKSYVIDISIPVIHLFAKESTISGPEVEPGGDMDKAKEPSRAIVGSGTEIHFEEDKVGSTCITFQFDNEKMSADIRNITGKPLEEDALMLKTKDSIVNNLVTYVLDKEHVKWIHYSIAVVTNEVDPDDKWSDFLRPTSCMFNTQPGAINVFIKTKGGTAGSGMSPPLFQHRSTRDILPFPTGFDSAIFISRRLFVDDFLLPNLNTSLKDLLSGRPIEVKKPASGTGMEINLRLEKTKTFNYYDLKSGWTASLFSIQDFTTDFDANPVTVVIDKGPDGITPEAKWHWEFTSTLEWDIDTSVGGSTSIGGKASVTSTMPGEPCPFATISGDTLDISLAFRDPTDQPKLSFEALYRKRPWYAHREMVKYVPGELHKLRVRLTPFEMKFPKLDFFATQNVFAPGTRFMTATQVLLPHDIVLAGKMVVVPAAGGGGGGGAAASAPAAAAAAESAPTTTELPTARSLDYSAYMYMSGAAAGAAQGLQELLDRLYTDNRFLGDAMAVADDKDGEAVMDWFREQGYQIAWDGVKKELEELTLPGPKFDVRFAGGVYKLKDESLGFEELFVHPVTRKIYIDGQETAESETDGTNGNLVVTATDGDGQEHHLKLEFVANKDGLIANLTGSTWPSDAPDKTSPVSGEIFFPWDDKRPTGPGRRNMSPAEKHWEGEANRYYAVGLDLVSPMRVPPMPAHEAAVVTERFFAPVALMGLPEITVPVTPAMCRDIVTLIEWPFTAPYRAFKFLQGVRKRKKNKVLDQYGDKAKLFIAEEPLPEEVLDQFHEAVERNVNEAMEVPGYRDLEPEKIRGFIERDLREELVRTLTGLSRRELAEQLKALEGVRGLQTRALINEAIDNRLEADIDRKNYEPYLDSCIAKRQAELKYEDAAKDVEKFQEDARKAQQEYEDHTNDIQKRKTELEAVRKDLEERPSEPESREERAKELEEEINKALEKQREAEKRRAEAEEKKGGKEKERDKENEEKRKREEEIKFHKKRWLKDHEKL
ncbi:predicted protein [Chaetomium globosum CBS 148.51]|uniref:Uncharacterized protein n=1 Tax=Chaetomium globosum (strain ATCC 6205 / CBS 148.51 / DSM 1962 / NBRC 6347 / NRRL 1970) TaxID=306901 RepID=Q2GVX2_CHAGB|nr:uncharacterized protein CHGG_07882 [Chaetomium globosum CBS 148.51]EAQ86629.1 predicted protein [Chaetomium globosum CBS 148.51]